MRIEPMAYSLNRTLPLGVAHLAVLIGIIGFLLLIAGILILAVAGYGAYFGSAALFGASLLGGILLIVFAVILLVVASGLWHQEIWALALSIIVVVILLISGALNGLFLSLYWIVLLVILVYLIAVRNRFD